MNSKEKRHSKKRHKRKSVSSDSSDSEEGKVHELYYYANDRVQLMKEVLKILKSKKIKSLAPPHLQKLPSEEINAMLLEELIGVSNKRLKKILDGQNAEDESSSSSEDLQAIDVISLDDISDEDFIIVEDSSNAATKKKGGKKVKTEKDDKIKSKSSNSKKESESKPQEENEKLLSVLELLELQARARAIRSQLLLEAETKVKEAERAKTKDKEDGSDDEAVIVETPQVNEIVISSSDEDGGKEDASNVQDSMQGRKNIVLRRKKFSDIPEDITKDKSLQNITNNEETSQVVPSNNENAEITRVEEIPLPSGTENNIRVLDTEKTETNKIISHKSDEMLSNSELNKINSDSLEANNVSRKDLNLEADLSRFVTSDKSIEDQKENSPKLNLESPSKEVDDQLVTQVDKIGHENIKVDKVELEKQEIIALKASESSKDDKNQHKLDTKNIEVLNIVKIVKNETFPDKTSPRTKAKFINSDEVIVIHLDTDEIEGIDD